MTKSILFGYVRICNCQKRRTSHARLRATSAAHSGSTGIITLKGRDDKFDDSSLLVSVHGDLNPRNIVAGEDGRLWLQVVDWGWSGFYPPWFELVAMTNQVEDEH